MYNLREIAEKFKIGGQYTGSILLDEPMAPRTTFKVGGNAPLLLEPNDTASLLYVIGVLKTENVPFFILGGGSNLVVSDEGFEGAVIATCGLDYITVDNTSNSCSVIVSCGSGTLMQDLVVFCARHAFSGLESFAGLPGTAGGAAYMNARCYGISVSDLISSAEYIENNRPATYNFREGDWSYKQSPFMGSSEIITKVSFRLEKKEASESSEIESRCEHYIADRVAKGHFRYPSAGSVFKNNREFGIPSGKIIDEVGLCGMKIGGAQVAPWHGNIIINRNHATQNDIRLLVDYIIREVKRMKGIDLEPEVIFCGK